MEGKLSALRITDPSPISILLRSGRLTLSSGVMAVDAADAGGAAGTVYTKNLAKLIPGEALALYATGDNVQVPTDMIDVKIWPIYCLVAAVIFRWLATKKPGTWQPQGWAVLIAAVSFVLWIYSQGSWFGTWQVPADYQHIIKYTMLFWVFVIPAMVGSDRR